MQMKRLFGLTVIGLALVAATALAAEAPATWNWAFPLGLPSAPPPKPDATTLMRLPGAPGAFTRAQMQDLGHAVDWRPAEHPPMPLGVAGSGKAYACGFCHGADGNGRPENAALAGLRADYIRRQVAAFAGDQRHAAQPGWKPSLMMITTAKAAPSADVAQAADYFSRLPYVSRVTVVEAAVIPKAHESHFIYLLDRKAREPLGQRIIETPDAPEAFEMRDGHARFTAYVPLGAVAQGAALVRSGGPAAQPCAGCHGVGLRGGSGPALAGRYPSYLARSSWPSSRASEPTWAAFPCGRSPTPWTTAR